MKLIRDKKECYDLLKNITIQKWLVPVVNIVSVYLEIIF